MTTPPKKILIIDDEERIRAIYKWLLEESGLTVTEAANAEEATRVMITEKVDLILLDINMPQVNGKTMFEVIQEYDPRLKVIVSSVYPVDVQRKMIPHAFDYHDKSEGSSSLLDKIHGDSIRL